jgi:hypothetical protein
LHRFVYYGLILSKTMRTVKVLEAPCLVEATTITVEVNIDRGIGYHLVGLPDNAIKK